MLKVFECFSGYGGWSFGLKDQEIPHEVVGYSEVDKYAVQCYDQNHNRYYNLCSWKVPKGIKSKNYGDITKIDIEDLPDFDLLCASPPCQAFSVAGKGQGVDDKLGRGRLFEDTIDIMRIKQPRYAIYENVKGLTFKKHKEYFDYIIKLMEDSGYHVKYKILNTKCYGIPQNRERIFIVCFKEKEDYNHFEFPEEEELTIFIRDILQEEPVDEKYYLKDHQIVKLIDAINTKMKKGISKTIRSGGRNSLTKKHEWDIVTIDTEGNPIKNIPEIGEAHRLYDAKGVSPSIKKSTICVGNINPSNKGMNGNVYDTDGISPTLTTNKGEGIKSVQWDASGKGYNSQQDRAYDVDGVMCCLPHANPTNKVNIFALRSYPRKGKKEIDGERVQMPEFRKDGCSNSLTSVEKDNLVRIYQKGRGFNPGGLKEDVCPTISKNSFEQNNVLLINPYNLKVSEEESGTIGTSVGTTTGKTAQIVSNCLTEAIGRQGSSKEFIKSCENIHKTNGIFRRLTPKECFRLQGFLKDEINLEGISNSQCYKLAGNGLSINVVSKIFKNMLK